jgi:hypothetical protein
MKAVERNILFIALFAVLGLVVVSAIGQSTIGRDSDESANRTQTDDLRGCDDLEVRIDRIRCRLAYAVINQSYDNIDYRTRLPEACMDLENQERCRQLYIDTQECYELKGTAKDRCFRENSGIGRNISEIAKENPEAVRFYVVVLLYELQERLEKAHENGRLTDDEAAQVIDKIVEIKRLILQGESKENIKIEIQELRELWRNIVEY